MKIKLISIFLFLFELNAFSQIKPEFLTQNNQKWVDSVFATLTLEEKIGQLLMPRGNTSGKGYDPEKLVKWVKDYKIGGLVFFAGQPSVQASIVNRLQSLSKVPMLIGMDMEWGMAMRLDSTVRFPYQLTLGSMQGGEDLIFRMGQEVGRHAKRMGIHVNYAPVVDINNNPLNPVINFRSFGQDKLAVANKALAYMQGMQSQKILVTAKHFPGHGDTGVDSHYDLPVINHDKKHLTETELFPYKYLINNGLSGIMTAHLSIPSLDNTPNLASTFSNKIVSDLLRKELKFEGLTFTDAMDMQGAVKHFPNGSALVKAILAGNDILETFEDVGIAVEAIKEAINTKKLPLKVLDEKVKKILKAKTYVGLDQYQAIKTEGLIEELNTNESDLLNRLFAEKTLVALKNKDVLPVKDLSKKTVIVSVDSKEVTAFQKMAKNYTEVDFLNFEAKTDDSISVSTKLNQIRAYENKIIGLHLANIRPGAQYGVSDFNKSIIKQLASEPNVILVVFGNPYALSKYPEINNFSGLVLANQLTKYTEEAAAMAVFGAIEINGKLPVYVDEKFTFDSGLRIENIGRLAYGTPEMVGVNGKFLESRLDSIINGGLKEKAYPGAVMEVAIKGRVVYKKAFGFHTYEQADDNFKKLRAKPDFERGNQSDVMDAPNNFSLKSQGVFNNKIPVGLVDENDLYDLASVTKVGASALAIMKLTTENKFSLDHKFGDLNPEFKNSDKESLVFRDLLTHKAGLKPFIAFWQNAIDSLATIQNVVMQNPELESRIERDYIKPKFLDKILKKPLKYNLNYTKTLQNNKNLWIETVLPKDLIWKSGVFSKQKTDEYEWQVCDSLFIKSSYAQKIFEQIKESPLKPEQGYVYSDLHYMIYPMMVKRLTGITFDKYLQNIYQSIGAMTLGFNPLQKYPKSKIAPTETDRSFRKTKVHGFVHDEGAALLGGISGHAGLFGSANDLTKLMQLYLQKGYYGGQQIISRQIVENWTDYQFPYVGNRRGIAFDKLDFNKAISNGPQMASPKSFGHSGFTGTFVWADPKYDMTYVFLSNRVYPSRENNKISTLNIRTELGNQIIKTIKNQ